MSVDLNSYFKLGLDSTENAGEQPGLINTIRTPVDTQSAQLNRVTFKVPKIGMLTGDSHINLRFTSTNPNDCALNLVNGALGAIERFRIIIGNKVLTDLEKPGMLENVKMYSNKSPTQLNDLERNFLGNNTAFDTTKDKGIIQLHEKLNARCDAIGNVYIQNMKIQTSACKTYAIPLRMLGAQFLETASLPVFLLGNREMIIEITFADNCLDYAFSMGVLGASQIKVDHPNVELITTHVMLPDDVENEQMMGVMNAPAQYPLIDNYVIKGVLPAGANGVEATNLYRLNLQNRELQRLLMVLKDTQGTYNQLVANQVAAAVGDESIQIKSNGLNVFERPVSNSAIVYQLLNYYNGGMAIKVPNQVYHGDRFSMACMEVAAAGSDKGAVRNYISTFHYLGFDFRNGNNGIFGAGSVQRQALEVDYSNTPRTDIKGNSASVKDVLFYASVSKMLSIGSNSIDVSF